MKQKITRIYFCNYLLIVFLLIFTFVLSACGGGGKSGTDSGRSTSSLDSLKFSADKSSLQFSVTEGAISQATGITLEISGTTKATFYVAAALDGIGLDKKIQIIPSSESALFSIAPDTTLAPGKYTGTLSLLACKDVDCKQVLGNTPIAIPYTVDILPIFKVDQSSISITTNFGEPISTKKLTIQLPFGSSDFTASANVGWVQLRKESATSLAIDFNLLPSYSSPYAGQIHLTSGSSSIDIPVTYVVNQKDLKISTAPLSVINAIGNWDTYLGSNSRNSYIASVFDTTKFSFRWRWPAAPSTESELNSVTISGGHVYVSASQSAANPHVVSLNEIDGSQDWYKLMTDGTRYISSPEVSGNQLFVATSVGTTTNLRRIDAANGNDSLVKTFFELQKPDGKPFFSIKNSHLFVNDFMQQTLIDLDLASAIPFWTTNVLETNYFTPAFDEDYAYVNASGVLKRIRLSDGSVASSLSIDVGATFANDSTPALLSDGRILFLSGFSSSGWNISEQKPIWANPRTLALLNVGGSEKIWSVEGNYAINPVVANGVVYALNEQPTRLEARDLADGHLLWSWPLDGTWENEFVGTLVLSNNLAFFSTNRLTKAVDIQSHKEVWAYPYPCKAMSISQNGILYLVTPDLVTVENRFENFYLTAINLH